MKTKTPKLVRLDNNFHRLDMGCYTLWFSYQTLVAFQGDTNPVVCIENMWSNTTGKHLNVIQPDKTKRLSAENFALAVSATGFYQFMK